MKTSTIAKTLIATGAILAVSFSPAIAQEIIVKLDRNFLELSAGVQKAASLIEQIFAPQSTSKAGQCDETERSHKIVIIETADHTLHLRS